MTPRNSRSQKRNTQDNPKAVTTDLSLAKTETVKKYHTRIPEKRWNHSKEQEIFETWQTKRIYKFRLRKGKKPFVIDTPPPYPSGTWHIGAVAEYSQIDMIARTGRMLGNPVIFPIGIDRNGLPVEIYTENLYKVKMRDVSREKFIELCGTALDDLESKMVATMKRLGLSGDYEAKYRTDQEEYRRLTQSTFIELWKKGLVYEATRPNNYCHECGTTIGRRGAIRRAAHSASVCEVQGSRNW